MHQKTKVVVIGAGSAGLSAIAEVKKVTDDFLVIHDGPMGTSCARAACMPTKIFIEAANAFHARKRMQSRGVHGVERLSVDIREVLAYVRKERDFYAGGMIKVTEKYKDHILYGRAEFEQPTLLRLGSKTIEAEKIIVATGSSPNIPADYMEARECILTTEEIIEEKDLPAKIAVIGLGPAGLEYAQALSRLGIEVIAYVHSASLGNITDPQVNASAREIMKSEFQIIQGGYVKLRKENNRVWVESDNASQVFEKVLLTIGRYPNLAGLGLENLPVKLGPQGDIPIDPETLRINDLPIYVTGDANNYLPILHEAVDEGRFAGFSAVHDEPLCFKRRLPIGITFSDPNIVIVGKSFDALKKEEIVIGEYDFKRQSRARMSDRNKGLLRIYAEKTSGRVVGSEMIAPAGEHLGHFLAMAIDRKLTVFDLLRLAYYHPAIEEGLRSAIRDAGDQTSVTYKEADFLLCGDNEPIKPLC